VDKRNKREIVEAMLSKGDAMICLDSRYPEVQVPEIHKGKADLRLVLNLNFRHCIHTLPDGIQAELLFGGVPFLCWIPYESLWAVYNPQTGEGYLWPGQTPVSLSDLVAGRPESKGKKGGTKRMAPAASPERPTNGDTSRASGPGKTAIRPKSSRSPRLQTSDRKDRPRFRIIPGGKKG
jgi:stringent starvation protein B